MTKEIKEKAVRQFDEGSDMEQMVVAKYFDAMGDWKWFLMNMDKDEDYCWGIVKGFAVEMGTGNELPSGPVAIGRGETWDGE